MADTHKFGDNIKIILPIIIGIMLFQSVWWASTYKKDDVAPEPITTECKADSLQNVIDSLTSDYEIQREGWEHKEKRYENIIFHYQFGLNYIKDYDPLIYQKIIRIAMLKENFSYDVEKEFKQQVNITKWD
jgi:hypothetical protein